MSALILGNSAEQVTLAVVSLSLNVVRQM